MLKQYVVGTYLSDLCISESRPIPRPLHASSLGIAQQGYRDTQTPPRPLRKLLTQPRPVKKAKCESSFFLGESLLVYAYHERSKYCTVPIARHPDPSPSAASPAARSTVSISSWDPDEHCLRKPVSPPVVCTNQPALGFTQNGTPVVQ